MKFFVSLQAEMRKIAILAISLMVMLIASCGQKKKDATYYEHMVDSIRKAEQMKELRRQAGITDVDPLEEFFLKLSLRSLPVQSEGKKWERLGEFTKVPRSLNEHFGYLSAAELQALAMPRAGKYQIVMLLEMQDSITPALYLYTMNHEHRNIDQLCIYEEKAEDRASDFGKTMMDYYITSDWEITLMTYYLSNEATSPELEETRRYVINKEGKFEETIIEL